MSPTASPPVDRYAVLGHPVAHSRSPFIHSAFASATGQALVYERVLAPLDDFAGSLRAFAQAGGRGCNVTVPFKFDAFALCPRHTERAALAQAANVIRFDAEGWLADNSDGIGLVRDIEAGAGRPLAGQRVLLIGAGGASAGVLGPLLAARPAELVLTNRSPDKALALAARHAAWADQHGVRLGCAPLADPGQGFDVLINASASSLAGGEVPVPASVLRPGSLAVDLMYGAAAAPFLAWAAQHGGNGRDGLGMLVEQAAEAFSLWRGVMPASAPVLQALRAQLAAEARGPVAA